MSRRARLVGVGLPHHIIQRGNNKQQIFFEDNDKLFYLRLLKKYSYECGCLIHAYCLMNNHVHILAVPRNEYALAKTMQKLSLTYTQYINKKYERTGRLWECRFYSSLVDREQYLWSVCRYIERNPVRIGIVDNPINYKWSSSIFNTTDKKSGLVEPIWKNDFQRKEYIEFLNSHEDEYQIDMIGKFTCRGRPIGDKSFINSISKEFGIEINNRPRGRPIKYV